MKAVCASAQANTCRTQGTRPKLPRQTNGVWSTLVTAPVLFAHAVLQQPTRQPNIFLSPTYHIKVERCCCNLKHVPSRPVVARYSARLRLKSSNVNIAAVLSCCEQKSTLVSHARRRTPCAKAEQCKQTETFYSHNTKCKDLAIILLSITQSINQSIRRVHTLAFMRDQKCSPKFTPSSRHRSTHSLQDSVPTRESEYRLNAFSNDFSIECRWLRMMRSTTACAANFGLSASGSTTLPSSAHRPAASITRQPLSPQPPQCSTECNTCSHQSTSTP